MRCLAVLLGIIVIGATGLPALADDAPTDEQQNLFDTLDTDGDGRLTESEVPEAQARFFGRLVRVGDEDGDGELTREEFLSATQERDTPVTEPEARGQGRGRQRGRTPLQFIPIDQLFERFDANDDDKLTLDEIPDEARPRLERLFQQSDSNEITREQLVGMSERFFNSGQVVGMLRRLDENGNGDGKVALSEVPEPFRPRLQPLFERFGGEELDLERVAGAMQQTDRNEPRGQRSPQDRPEGDRPPPAVLRALDSDGDGRISREELSDAAGKFDELDRNGDDQIDARELFGFPPRDGAGPGAQQPGQRPQRPEGATDRRRPEGATDRQRRPDAENDNPPAARTRPDRPAADARSTSPDRRTDTPRQSLLSRFDRDGDEALSEDETPDFLKDRFDQIDADSDGLISADEMRSIRSTFRRDGNRPGNRPGE